MTLPETHTVAILAGGVILWCVGFMIVWALLYAHGERERTYGR